jgi:hypothetical protein
VYLKEVDASIKALNFVSFYLKMENFLKGILIISPFFFSERKRHQQIVRSKEMNAKIAMYTLGVMFALAFGYGYHHPPEKEMMKIEQDFTKQKFE